ncbi:MAG: precorrin-4 C(11)-methyltransferase [Lentisphaerae bacterium]|nr:precorrin-4 C(11)-methyltransferase [Lentisphaerota bacterium]MCP4103301.1 precorrin-4 C(11)-methyltransferase [Lentisphaerota bacterium]
MKGKVIIAGAGPGAVDLITLRAKNALEQADVIIYAGSLVNPEILAFAKKEAEKVNSAGLSLDEVIALTFNAVNAGKNVVRLHTGDPAMYGAISEQMNELDKLKIKYEVIPGVSSVFAAAAAVKAELTMPGITQTAILTRRAGRTPVPEAEDLKKLAANDASIALFLSVADMPGLVADFIEAGRSPETPVAVVYRASWPNQKVVRGTLADISEKIESAGIKRQAIILVGGAIERGGEKSLLYDSGFAHGYRGAKENVKFEGKTAIYAITEKGALKAGEIAGGMTKATVFVPEKFSSQFSTFESFGSQKLGKLIKHNWHDYDAHLFIMATGIAVRKIAPLLEGKTVDPAVVVCDELGNNSISLLSGHIGGANRLASTVAGITGGKAVITTATDTNKLVAFDELAAINGWQVCNPEMIKVFNARLLAGEEMDLMLPEDIFEKKYKDIRGLRLIAGLSEAENPVVTLNCKKSTKQPCLRLFSTGYAIGIGCRRNITVKQIEKAVRTALNTAGLKMDMVRCLASADVKRYEAGLLDFATDYNLLIKFYGKESLNSIVTPHSSPRAEKEFGIKSVAEAAAMLAAGTDKLVLEKQKIDGVTIAIAAVSPEKGDDD